MDIYGEAINDFYLNIVKDENILITYLSKRGYSERNVKGIEEYHFILDYIYHLSISTI